MTLNPKNTVNDNNYCLKRIRTTRLKSVLIRRTVCAKDRIAHAKVSARQQCVYEGPPAKKSTANQQYTLSY